MTIAPFTAVGSDVDIVVAVTNVSDQTITCPGLRWVPSTVFEVRDADGNLASETETLRELKREFYKDGQWHGHLLSSQSLAKPTGDHVWVGPLPNDDVELQPGNRVSFGTTPNRYYEMSQPGVYSIVAKRHDEKTQEWVYSNKITVTISVKAKN